MNGGRKPRKVSGSAWGRTGSPDGTQGSKHWAGMIPTLVPLPHQGGIILSNLFRVSLQCFAQSKYSIHTDVIQQIFSSCSEPGLQFGASGLANKLIFWPICWRSTLSLGILGKAAGARHIPAPAACLPERSLKPSFRLTSSSTCNSWHPGT